jgi:phosphatidylinositol-3-phosphatase
MENPSTTHIKLFACRYLSALLQTICGTLIRVLVLFLSIILLTACDSSPQQPVPTLTHGTVPAFSHIFIIVMENKEYNAEVSAPQAPYFNKLADTYALATQYYGISHPSLPNYLALTSGSTLGISSDCTTCFQQAPNLADQLEASGHSWKAYMEGMPAPCYVGDSPDGLYAQKHNPFVYYDNIRTNKSRCTNHVVPFSQFTRDLANKQLPDFIWITPSMCHDTHDCPVSDGDSWLSDIVPTILQSPAFTHNGVLFITFDEGATDNSCCNGAEGGKIATLVISPLVKKGFRSTVPETHYSLLRTIEDAWKLPPLGEAKNSNAMTEYFPD